MTGVKQVGVAPPAEVVIRWADADHGSATPQGLLPLLAGFGKRALHRLHRSVEVSVLLCDAGAIRALNARYRGIDAPTDVLSFGQFEGAEPAGPAPDAATAPPAGDVVIAVDVAARQAAAAGESLERELCRLLLHGMLHLIGMDHADPPGEDEPMLTLQEQIIRDLQPAAGRSADLREA